MDVDQMYHQTLPETAILFPNANNRAPLNDSSVVLAWKSTFLALGFFAAAGGAANLAAAALNLFALMRSSAYHDQRNLAAKISVMTLGAVI